MPFVRIWTAQVARTAVEVLPVRAYIVCYGVLCRCGWPSFPEKSCVPGSHAARRQVFGGWTKREFSSSHGRVTVTRSQQSFLEAGRLHPGFFAMRLADMPCHGNRGKNKRAATKDRNGEKNLHGLVKNIKAGSG